MTDDQLSKLKQRINKGIEFELLSDLSLIPQLHNENNEIKE